MNEESGEKLYEAYYMRVYSYAVTLSGSRQLAEEITQETFFRAIRHRREFRQEADEVTWLCTIAKNLFYDEKRREKKSVPLPEDAVSEEKSIEQAAVDRDSSFRVHLALHALEEPYREVFELRVFGELSFREVGMIFSKTENWARVTYHRARLKLQERMKTDED